MDNNAFQEDSPNYDNVYVTPDIITQQPINSQISNGAGLDEPITDQPHKTGNDAAGYGGDSKTREWKLGDSLSSVEGENTNREWASGLFDSLTGKLRKNGRMGNVKQALLDCCCLPCTMCTIARRVGDPPYLPFLPCIGPALRFKVRILGAISGSIGKDCLVTSCCWPCAVCQMYRELEDIGL